jgi:hypothetical protein
MEENTSKNMRTLFKIYCLLMSMFCSCNFTKKMPQNIDQANNNRSKDAVHNSQNATQISCNGTTYNIDFKSYKEVESLMLCISDSIFIGNQSSINKYIAILNRYMDYEDNWFIFQHIIGTKARGNRCFEQILKKSNFFGCYHDYSLSENGNYQVIPYHLIFYNQYASMIRSINGMTVQEYLNKNLIFTIEIQIKMEDEDKCQETLYKLYYNAIKEANLKGLIKLKDFGEE